MFISESHGIQLLAIHVDHEQSPIADGQKPIHVDEPYTHVADGQRPMHVGDSL